jgi:CRP/FNR family transcriptional regulator, dissimilatory nitrate respiration regulator
MTDQTVADIAAVLARSDLFGGLPEPDRKRLAETCRLRTYPKRAILFHEGETGEKAFLLIRGRVQLHRVSGSGKEVVIKTAGPGEFFAEVILFERRSYPVSAVSLVESRCVEIQRREFRALMEDTGFRDRFIGLLITRQRYLADRIQYLMLCDLEERFFHYLQDNYGDRTIIHPGIARKDIAAAVGSTPESFSRLIRRLSDEGRISWKGNTLRIAREREKNSSITECPDGV